MSCAAPFPCRRGHQRRLFLLVATALFFLSTFPDPAPAQTVSFIARRDLAAGRSPDSVAVGDFNGDGRLDLATANFDSNDVSVLLGNGDGSFQAALTAAAGRGPSSVAVGDVNGDGKLDLVVVNLVAGDSASVSVLLGNGDGTFQAARISSTGGSRPASVAVGDFNGLGKPDLAVANSGSGSVSVLLGNGDGTFLARPFAAGAVSVAVGDFN